MMTHLPCCVPTEPPRQPEPAREEVYRDLKRRYREAAIAGDEETAELLADEIFHFDDPETGACDDDR